MFQQLVLEIYFFHIVLCFRFCFGTDIADEVENFIVADEVEINKFASLANKWWDADGPLKTLHDINPTRVEYINNFQTLAGVRILDIGCGGGILSEAMAKDGGFVSAIDAENKSIQIATEHAQKSALKIDYKCKMSLCMHNCNENNIKEYENIIY